MQSELPYRLAVYGYADSIGSWMAGN